MSKGQYMYSFWNYITIAIISDPIQPYPLSLCLFICLYLCRPAIHYDFIWIIPILSESFRFYLNYSDFIWIIQIFFMKFSEIQVTWHKIQIKVLFW